MSSLIPKREPAWAGHVSGLRADFSCPVSASIRTWLADAVASNFAFVGNDVGVVGRLRDDNSRIGHYLVTTAAGACVAHVKSASVEGDLKLAADFADWLADGAVSVASYLRSREGKPECVVNNLHITLTHFVTGRHVEYSAADAGAVGVGLAALHKRAATFPSIDAIRNRARRVVEVLEQTRDRIVAGQIDLVPSRFEVAVRQAAEAYTAADFGSDPQCGHGDVSPGNVVFKSDGCAVFCDFEDSAFCFRPRTFDLGMAALRFALEGGIGPDESNAEQRLKTLVTAYENEASIQPISYETVRKATIALSNHFLLVLTNLAGEGLVLDDVEWEKACGWRYLAGGTA